jgi:hypothetical protein
MAPMIPALAEAPIPTLIAMLTGAGGAELGRMGGAALDKKLDETGKSRLLETSGEQAGALLGGSAPSASRAIVLGAAKSAFPNLAARLENAGLRGFAELVPESERPTEYKTNIMVDRLREIKDKLPWLGPVGARRGLAKAAEKGMKETGPKVSEAYAKDVPVERGLGPVAQRLEEEKVKNWWAPPTEEEVAVGTPGGPGVSGPSPTATEIVEHPPVYHSDKENRSLTNALVKLRTAGKSFERDKGYVSLEDLFSRRKSLDSQLKDADFTKRFGKLNPNAKAMRAEREATSRLMHEETGSIPSKGIKGPGELADDMFSAWAHMKKAGRQPEAGNFVQRWLTARLISGPVGTVAGAAVARNVFLKTFLAKNQLKMADALKNNDQAALAAILRNAISGLVSHGS